MSRIVRSVTAAMFLLSVFYSGIAAAETQKVRLGIGYALAYVPLYVAKEKGFFKKEGVDVEFVPIEIVPDMIQSIIGGSTDAGVGGTFALITFIAKGAPVSAVGYYGYGGNRIALAARKGSGIQSIKDLEGKSVAVQTGTIAAQMWTNMVAAEKIDTSKIDVKNIRNLDIPASVASGAVDAIITWEPNPTTLEERGLVKVIQRAGKYQESYGAVIFGNKFISENPKTVQKFLTAHFQASQFVRQHPKEAAEIAAKYVRGSTVETLMKSNAHMVFDPRITSKSLQELGDDIKFMRKEGRLSRDIKPEQLVTPQFSDELARTHPKLSEDIRQ